MRFVMLACVITACEPMAPSGNPLEPVAVEVAMDATMDALPADDAATDGSGEDLEEVAPFTISSEELHAVADEAGPEPEAPTDTPAVESASEPEAAAQAAPAAAPASATPQPPARSGWPEGMGGTQWPVRLVTTVPNASPPRAILGLPDGREIVVNPGSMVPDMGLVVVAIAPGAAELAKIAAAGDHATIESITLQAQY